MTDSLFSDTSEFQCAVDDSYPHRIISFRSNDGTYEDHVFDQNYRWACRAADEGRIACFIVYMVYRPNWSQTLDTHKAKVERLGGPHPKMITMLDVESWGGQIGGDQSDGINRLYWGVADWLGNPQRVIGYANWSDFRDMWPTRPDGLRVVGAGYGQNPNLPGQIAHQYTDGQGYGGGLPEGASPFGNCDMNSADGLSPEDFAAACGVGTAPAAPIQEGPLMALDDDEQRELLEKVRYIAGQLGPWPQLGTNDKGKDLTVVDALAKHTGGGTK
jgi:hypothetical protein